MGMGMGMGMGMRCKNLGVRGSVRRLRAPALDLGASEEATDGGIVDADSRWKVSCSL
jgi:hypothetical protein